MKKIGFKEVCKIIAVLLTGLLFGVMAAMMDAGGSVSFSDFLQAGEVYDFSQKALTKSNEKWIYNEENGEFQIIAKKAVRRFVIAEKDNYWNYLVVDIEKMNVPQLEAELRYYDSQKNRVFEQLVILYPGENRLELLAEIPFCEIGFYVRDAEGLTISFESMQIREKESGYEPVRFRTVFAAYWAGFVLVCAVIWFGAAKIRTSFGRAKKRTGEFPGRELVCLYTQWHGSGTGWTRSAVGLYGRSFWRRLTFSLLFFWCISMNVLGWQTDKELYRCDLLVCAVLFLIQGFLCGPGEGVPRKVVWKSSMAYAWMGLWCGTIVSDLFTEAKIHFLGYVMIFAVGFFIYRWNQMRYPEQLLGELSEALEIDFGLSLCVCLFFRPKLLAVAYNGIFRNPEDNAMFALLMTLVLWIEIERMMFARKKGKKLILLFTELALAVFLVLRAENRTGYVVLALFLVVFVWRMIRYRRQWGNWFRQSFGILLISLALAGGATGAFHAGIKYIPAGTGWAWEYKGEEKISMESEQILDDLEAFAPELLRGVTRAEEIETAVIQKNYLRRLNLFGNGGTVKVFREETPAYNGYLAAAFRYGIFILVPLILYQIAVVWSGMDCLSVRRKKKERGDGGLTGLLLLGTGILCIAFALGGNAAVSIGHPAMICMYASCGCRFTEKR